MRSHPTRRATIKLIRSRIHTVSPASPSWLSRLIRSSILYSMGCKCEGCNQTGFIRSGEWRGGLPYSHSSSSCPVPFPGVGLGETAVGLCPGMQVALLTPVLLADVGVDLGAKAPRSKGTWRLPSLSDGWEPLGGGPGLGSPPSPPSPPGAGTHAATFSPSPRAGGSWLDCCSLRVFIPLSPTPRRKVGEPGGGCSMPLPFPLGTLHLHKDPSPGDGVPFINTVFLPRWLGVFPGGVFLPVSPQEALWGTSSSPWASPLVPPRCEGAFFSV